MTGFDKLIKEKAEQAEYTYKPSVWRQFQRKAGLGQTATRYWVIGVSSAVLVGGFVAFFGHRMNQRTPEKGAAQTTLDVDTLSSQPMAPNASASDTFQVLGDAAPVSVSKHHSAHTKPTSETPAAPAAEPQVAQPSPKVNKTTRFGRPLVIDVDTIKENVPTDEELKNGNSRLF